MELTIFRDCQLLFCFLTEVCMTHLLWILLGTAVTAALALLFWALDELKKERRLRQKAEDAAAFWKKQTEEDVSLWRSCEADDRKQIHDAVKETQSMVCQGVETICAKLDELADGGADPETRKTLVDDLNKLMSYGVNDALRAAGLDRGDSN